jgi:hypothetical protein
MRTVVPLAAERRRQPDFHLPLVTIENLLVLDSRTLAGGRANNFPAGGGRELASDNTEFLRVRLAGVADSRQTRRR